MSYEVILPMPVSLGSLVDQLAHASWKALVASRDGTALYPGYFIPLRQAIEEELTRNLLGEEDLGSAHGYRFAGGGEPGSRLEDGIVLAVVARLHGVLGNVVVAGAFQRTVPAAIHSVLEPFLWFEGDDGQGRSGEVSNVPGPRAGHRSVGSVVEPGR